MAATKSVRFRLAAFTGATLLVLLVLPATRWIMARQLAAQFSPPRAFPWVWGELESQGASKDRALTDAALQATALAHPDDFAMQLAAALSFGEDRSGSEARLRALLPRWGHRSSLHAALLRVAAKTRLGFERNEGEKLKPPPPVPSSPPQPEEPVEMDRLADFTRIAAQGERLDPDNAFFPMLRADLLFSARRDAEALAAIRRAGAKSRWEDYVGDEADGKSRIAREAFGDSSAAPRAIQIASILLPHYARLREAARLATVRAMEAEQAGRVGEGWAIRHALMRSGGLMRAHSQMIIGSFVGKAIVQIAVLRPGGSPVTLPAWKNLSGEQRARRKLREYQAYLRRAGFSDAARWMGEEWEKGERLREITQALARTDYESYPFGKPLIGLVAWWTAGVLVLGIALGTLALGGAAALLSRSRRVQLGTPPSAIATLTVVALCSFAPVVWWRMGGFRVWWDTLRRFEDLCFGPQDLLPLDKALLLTGVGGALLPVLLLPLGLMICSLVLRVPLRLGMMRGYRGLVGPVACTLLLIWSGMVVVTGCREADMNDGLDQIQRHEGRYIARITGQSWPETP